MMMICNPPRLNKFSQWRFERIKDDLEHSLGIIVQYKMCKRTDLAFTLQNCSQKSRFYDAQINIQQSLKDLTGSLHLG
jgi:hypothetical protein